MICHARDTLLGHDVAIKELVPSAVSDPEWLKRFFVEARATLVVHDDHIVSTHTVFAESGNHYLVMQYMPAQLCPGPIYPRCFVELILRHIGDSGLP